MKNTFIALLIALTFPSFAEETPATAPAPSAAPQFTGKEAEVKKRMDVLFELSKHVNHIEAKKRNEARSAIDAALDWDRVSEDAIGSSEWRKLSAANRTSFRDLLKDVIVRTAYTRLDKFWEGGTTFSIDKITMEKGGKAHLVAKFVLKEEPFILDYYLYSKGPKWNIYDIAFEGERYSININEQITAFLREKSFSGLLDKLRKRRAELISDAEKPKKKG